MQEGLLYKPQKPEFKFTMISCEKHFGISIFRIKKTKQVGYSCGFLLMKKVAKYIQFQTKLTAILNDEGKTGEDNQCL